MVLNLGLCNEINVDNVESYRTTDPGRKVISQVNGEVARTQIHKDGPRLCINPHMVYRYATNIKSFKWTQRLVKFCALGLLFLNGVLPLYAVGR